MKHILIVNDLLDGGGVEVVMKNLVSYLLTKGHLIDIMTLDERDGIPDISSDRVKYLSAKPYIRKYRKKQPLRWFAEKVRYQLFIRSCQRKYYDVVIGIKEGLCTKLASYFGGGKRLSWIHVDYSYLYWTKEYFGKNDSEIECLKRFDHVVCVSKAAQTSLIKIIGDPENTVVRYNPIDHRLINEKAAMPCDMKKDPSKPLFIDIARLSPPKNVPMLCRVCSKLQNEYDFELWIIGDGEEMEECRKILKGSGCTSVRLLGSKSNPYNYLRQADVFISTAEWESYGLAIQEALILGVPVVTTRCPAIEECFDTRYGIITDYDETAVYDSMKRILDEPELAAKYRENIRKSYDAESLWLPRLESIEELFS